jgi:gamma-glutamylcyclotransferase (GGCT)/AIG2-like uncharacterized protein YtfP
MTGRPIRSTSARRRDGVLRDRPVVLEASPHQETFTGYPMHVFTYGSLMFDRVWRQVAGRSYETTAARLYGYARRKIKNETYPAIVPAGADSFVDGRLYVDVDEGVIAKLDCFEGDAYRQTKVTCELPDGSGRPSLAYVFKSRYRHRLESVDWDPVWFSRIGIHRFLSSYEGFTALNDERSGSRAAAAGSAQTVNRKRR